jgi:hypothetical protein
MKKKLTPLPPDESDDDYLRALRVRALHRKFMEEIVKPARKELA